MSIFNQNNFDISVYNTLLADPNSEINEKWTRSAFNSYFYSVHLSVSVNDESMLVCQSDRANHAFIHTDNLPTKYIPGLTGIDFSNSFVHLISRKPSLRADGFNTIKCINLDTKNIKTLKGFNIVSLKECKFYGIQRIYDTNFDGNIAFVGNKIPKLKNCTSSSDIEINITLYKNQTDGLLARLLSVEPDNTTYEFNQTLWEAPHECELSDIIDISNISCNKIKIYYSTNLLYVLHIEFNKTDKPSRSHVRGWDITYYKS